MTEFEQKGFDKMPSSTILAPGEAHLACVLLLDTSGAMAGEPIDSLNKAINDFKKQISKDELARKCFDIAIVEFNSSVRIVQDFVPISQMQPVMLFAQGLAFMGAGINFAIDKVKERNRFYASMGTPYYLPRIFMFTNGAPNDDVSSAKQRIIEEESKGSHGHLEFWAVGVPGYDKDTLNSLTKRCIVLDEMDFSGVFNLLSESLCKSFSE